MDPAPRLRERHATYVSLWLFALAFGWIEACVVVYLRDLYLRDAALNGPGIGLQVTAVALPIRTVELEVVREACTLLVLAAVGWMSSRRMAGRWGAFLTGFGIWDLMYYAGLWLAIAWPESLHEWDILFLIPVPWVAPVWAPVVIASIFVAIGTWFIYTEHRPRAWRWTDALVVGAACAIVVGSFLVVGAAVEHRIPDHFPVATQSGAAVEHRVPRERAPGCAARTRSYTGGVGLGVGWVVRCRGRSTGSAGPRYSRGARAGGPAPDATGVEMRYAVKRVMTNVLAAVVLVLLGHGMVAAQDKPVTATDAWVKLPEPGAKSTVAFATINNPGMYAIYLVSGTSDVAGKIEFRDASKDNAVQEDVTVIAYDSTYMNPKGVHIYLSDLKKELKEGDTVYMTLKTELGIPVEVEAKVRKE